MAETLAKPKSKLSSIEKEQIIKKYMPLVNKIARSLARRSCDPVDDLIQVGSIGLLEASERYEEKFATEFKTYATHFITGHIRHYLRDKQNLVKGPRSLQELSYRVNQIISKLSFQFGREPTNIEVANSLEISPERIDEIKIYDRRVTVLWLDQDTSEGEGEENSSLWDSISISKSKNSKDDIDNRLSVKDAMEKLSYIYRKILELRYFQDMTQSEISQTLGISQMEVCRKLKKAEKELKRILNN